MCGIVGVVSQAPVNQLLYDALLLLQHRGQDAAGIVTLLERKFFMQKAKGMVRDVFRTRNMRALPGTARFLIAFLLFNDAIQAVVALSAVRPGASWYCQYRLVWAMTRSGVGAPYGERSSVVCASETRVAS